jgi:hypothetical protein
VRNLGANGDGRSSSPFNTIAEAAATADVNDYIYLFTGSGTAFNQDKGITLQNGQKLVGEGADFIIDNVTIFPAGTQPVISNTEGDAVTLAADNTVRGIAIESPLGYGIYAGYQGGDYAFEELTITDTVDDGIYVVGDADSVVVDGCTISTVGQNELGVYLELFSAVTVQVTNNTLSGNGVDFTQMGTAIGIRHGVSVAGGADYALTATIADNTITGATGGINVYGGNKSGDSVNPSSAVVTDNVMTGLGSTGLVLAGTDGPVIHMLATGNTLSGVAGAAVGIGLGGYDENGGLDLGLSADDNEVTGFERCVRVWNTWSSNPFGLGDYRLLLTNSTLTSCSTSAVSLRHDNPIGGEIHATFEGNTATDGFSAATADVYVMLGDPSDVGKGNEFSAYFLNQVFLGGLLGSGTADNDQGNLANNNNTSAGGAPVVTGGSIEIVSPAAVLLP